MSRYMARGDEADFERALTLFKEGWQWQNANPSDRIRLARKAAMVLADRSAWDEASVLLGDAVELLPIVSPRSLQRSDSQYMLSDFAGTASIAASLALLAGRDAYHALRLLELGRGVISSYILDMRTDTSTLERQFPALADEFVSLRNELDSPLRAASDEDGLFWESGEKRRYEADKRLNVVINEIRAKPGFHQFLLPPTPEEMMAAANPDPIIVVNVSSLRCDALIIEHNQIRLLELPDLSLEEIEKRTILLRSFRLGASPHMTSTLEWLWDAIAAPAWRRLN